MDSMSLAATPRERRGKGGARTARREGNVPAIVYGGDRDPLMVNVPFKDLTIMMGQGIMTTMIALKMDGGDSHQVLARDIQVDPVTDRPIHVDFMRVSARTEVSVSIPVTFLNEAECPALKQGGIMNVELHEIDCTCRATSIPDKIEVDLAGLEVNGTLHTSDLKLPDGVRLTNTDHDQTIVTIAVPRAVSAAGDGGEATEDGDAEVKSEE